MTSCPASASASSAKGHASYFVKYNVGTQQRRKTLGKVVRGNLKAMRLEASAILAKARLGTDVVGVAKAAAAKNIATLGELVPKYLEARESELRPKSHSRRHATWSAPGCLCTRCPSMPLPARTS